jgi:hypothetical protein
MVPHNNRKKKLKSDIANAESWLIPALAKKKIVVASLKPKPPMDIGRSVMALIMGKKIRK